MNRLTLALSLHPQKEGNPNALNSPTYCSLIGVNTVCIAQGIVLVGSHKLRNYWKDGFRGEDQSYQSRSGMSAQSRRDHAGRQPITFIKPFQFLF